MIVKYDKKSEEELTCYFKSCKILTQALENLKN